MRQTGRLPMRASSSRATSGKLWLTSAVGAFAALALAGTAWSGSGSELRNDETYNQFIAVPLPAGSAPLVSFDISWVDNVLRTYYLADRNNKSVDAVSTLTYGVSLLQPGGAGFVGAPNT